MPKHAFDHLVDLVRFPDVDLHRKRIEARVSQSGGALFEVLGVAAADDEAPSSPRRKAIASPIPVPPPVMMATWF
jgi:hypothetical protein